MDSLKCMYTSTTYCVICTVSTSIVTLSTVFNPLHNINIHMDPPPSPQHSNVYVIPHAYTYIADDV